MTLGKGKKTRRRITIIMALALSAIVILTSVIYLCWAFAGFTMVELEACALIDCARDAQYGWSSAMLADMQILDALEKKFLIAIACPGIPMAGLSFIIFKFWDHPKTSLWVKRMCK